MGAVTPRAGRRPADEAQGLHAILLDPQRHRLPGLEAHEDAVPPLRALLVVERLADLHALGNLEERVRHPAADDHLVDLCDEVLEQQDLVGDLGAAEDGEDGLGGRIQDLRAGPRRRWPRGAVVG